MQTSSARSRIVKWLPWMCLVGGFALTIGFYAIHGKNMMDSDHASELILANLLNNDGGILSKGWYYSTELRVLNSQLVYRLGLIIFSDWHAATTFSLGIMLLILITSYIFLAKTAGFLRIGLWTAVILTLPFSRQYAEYFLFGGYYMPHISISFICVGLMIRISTRWGQMQNWKRITETIFLIALCMVAGIGGIRALVICYIPMFITAMLLLLTQIFKVKNSWGEKKRASVFSLLVLIAGVTGYLINGYLLTHGYTAATTFGVEFQAITLKSIRHILAQAAWAIGWNGFPGETLVQMLQSLMTIMLTLLIMLSYIRGCCRWNKLNYAKQFLLLFFPINFLLIVFASALTGNEEARFLLPSLLYFPCILQIGLEGITLRWRNFACVALTICIVTNSTCVLFKMDLRGTSSIEEVAVWLVDNGYTKGFATFWNSNIVTALSDGKVEMWTVAPSWMPEWSELTLYPWLQEKDHLENIPEEKIFLLLTSFEDGADLPFSQGDREVYRCNDYTVYEYENAEKMYRTLKTIP